MICVVIKGPTFEEAHHQITAALPDADLVELRLDGFCRLDETAIKQLTSAFAIPMIFTLRCRSQGGYYRGSESERLADISRLAALRPAYLDLESCIPPVFVEAIAAQYPEIKIITSHHDFKQTPKKLAAMYQTLRQRPATFYKIAVQAEDSTEALRLLCWHKTAPKKLITIGMGQSGQVSRILARLAGCPITYACLSGETATAPGQLTAKVLSERYRYRMLNPKTKVYGLIGDPVEQSISDCTHNALMQACGLDAVYVKMPVKSAELAEFLHLARQLPFHGLSVTMPLKECILPHLDHLDPMAIAIGAVNTLCLKDGKISGFNTDGIGALNAMEEAMPVANKRMLILGAGGSARAIAYEACQRGALVTILGRDGGKARLMAARFQSVGKDLSAIDACYRAGYDILVNTTPLSMPIQPRYILPQAMVMDINTKPKMTLFLQQAKELGCPLVYGYQMFIRQAALQFDLWFDQQPLRLNHQLLEKTALTCLSG